MSTALSKDLAASTAKTLAEAVGSAQVGVTPEPMPQLNGLLLQLPGNPNLYLVINGYRCWIPDSATFQNLFPGGATIVQDINIGAVSEGPPLTSGAVLAQANGSAPVYLVTNGVKMWIPTPDIFARYQFNAAKILGVAPIFLNFIPSGPDLQGPTS